MTEREYWQCRTGTCRERIPRANVSELRAHREVHRPRPSAWCNTHTRWLGYNREDWAEHTQCPGFRTVGGKA